MQGLTCPPDTGTVTISASITARPPPRAPVSWDTAEPPIIRDRVRLPRAVALPPKVRIKVPKIK